MTDVPVYIDGDIGQLYNKYPEDIALREIGQAIVGQVADSVELKIYTRRTKGENSPSIGDIRFVVYGRTHGGPLWYVATTIADSWLNDDGMDHAFIVQTMVPQINEAASRISKKLGR